MFNIPIGIVSYNFILLNDNETELSSDIFIYIINALESLMKALNLKITLVLDI
jgi:hypothetical protein